MKKSIKCSFTLGFLIASYQLYSQPTISSSIGNQVLVCPGAVVEYKVSYPTGSKQCSVTWRFENGSGNYALGYNANSNPTRVMWDDQKPNKVKIKVDVNYRVSGVTCTSPLTETLEFTHILRTVFQESMSNISTLPLIPLCDNSVRVVSVGHKYVANTGASGEPPLTEVDFYQWTIPEGWVESGTGATGTINSPFTFISIVPTSSKGGTVTVKGYVNISCQNTNSSIPANVPVNRTPVVSITPPANFIGAACGVTNPLIFSVNTISCATNYSWVIPQGWSGTSNSNTITVIPSGLGGGQLKSIITLSIGTTVERTYNISFINSISNPIISSTNSNSEICSGESYTYTCVTPSGYPTDYGFDWYAMGGLLINGTSTSLSNPFHSTSNSVTVSATPGSYGTGAVFVRMNSSPSCNPSNYVYLTKQVGPFSSSQFSISGPSELCPNTSEWYLSNYIDTSITSYQWSWSSAFTSQSGQGTPYLGVTTVINFSGGAITLRIGNRCGLTGSPAIKYITAASCFGNSNYNVSPNPANEVLIIIEESYSEEQQSILGEPLDAKVALVNNRSQVILQGDLKKGKLELDVAKVPSDLYILRISLKEKVVTKQVMILH